jgi:hypothetical protein
MKYNFVIFATDFYCYETCYDDIIGLDNVRYIKYLKPSNKLVQFIYRIHHSEKINKYINIPLKRIWFGLYFKNDFKDTNPICFLFFGRNLPLEKYGYVKYLKNKYFNSKFVCFFQDLISEHKNIDVLHIKNIFDLVITYDQNDAKKFEINYHPTVYSNYIVTDNNNISKTDVYFLGADKNRLNKIIEIYSYLQSLGLKCSFYITNVKPENQFDYIGIHYIKSMTYEENLQHVLKSECVLEIMQENAQGFTMRTWEAIMYDKKLLTDNVEIKKATFYNASNILVFSELNSIVKNKNFFDNIACKANYDYKDEISPLKLLEFITDKLSTNQH